MPVLLIVALLLGGRPMCLDLVRPVPGVVVRAYAPVGHSGGHWGIDLAAPTGTPVRSVAAGRVTFAGAVAGRLSVTVDHGGSVRTSYSYLETIAVSVGRRVGTGSVLGTSGVDRGIEALHLSLRVGASYRDPAVLFECSVVPAPGTRLRSRSPAPVYAVVRATRSAGRNLRSSSPRPPRCRR